jgi:hypothetical protein
LARGFLGVKQKITKHDSIPGHSQYWNGRYRIESLVQLEELLETTMKKQTFQKINQPCLTLYYYRNENEQDTEVKVSAMLEMHAQLSTPDSLKVEKAIPTAGAHVIGGSLASKDVESVYGEIKIFATQQLGFGDHAIAIKK